MSSNPGNPGDGVNAPGPTGDVEQPRAKGDVAQPPAIGGSKDSAFKRFLSGPYFDVIPPQFERIANAARAEEVKGREATAGNAVQEAAPATNYLERLRSVAGTEVDTDGKYGLEPHELVPLPFDVPKWHAYLVDILLGTYQVAQATIVMFMAIYVENQERAWKDGSAYTKSWLPLVKALIIVYPLITLIILVTLTIEYCIRKFMYYRLLSMRILVDWKNYKPWHSTFFLYFVGTWVLMNAWAIYGLGKYYNKDGNQGVDPVSFSTFVVVNLQTVQLFIYYFKLLSTESRLVSLNQIFERAPVEAQRLLEFTYVIEEEDLVRECYEFAAHTQRAFWFRLINLISFNLLCKGWETHGKEAKFDIKRLKDSAPNRHAVEENVDQAMGRTKEARAAEGIKIEVGGSSKRPELEGVVKGCAVWRPMRWAYQNAYASLHSLHCSIMVHYDNWPFRQDIAYFRMLTLIQMLGIIAVGAIVVLGWQFSTKETNCTKSAKTCNTCLAVHERYFASAEPLCSAMETAVAKIVASANGTWISNGVREERYCNWACYGNFTPTQPGQSCPA